MFARWMSCTRSLHICPTTGDDGSSESTSEATWLAFAPARAREAAPAAAGRLFAGRAGAPWLPALARVRPAGPAWAGADGSVTSSATSSERVVW
jgi:hypothetical protein